MTEIDHAALLADLPRFAHLIGIALGLGGGLIADLHFLRFLVRPFGQVDLDYFHRMHRIVGKALVLLWFSGLVLFWMRTGFDPDKISAKLITKFAVVGVLTANALLVGRIALPILGWMVGRRLGDLSSIDRLRLCIIGALSAASWLGGLTLGVFAMLKTLPAASLLELFAGLYGLALASALILTFAARIAVRMGHVVPRHDRAMGVVPF